MITICAACGKQMEATEYAVITSIGLANNICSNECLIIYNSSIIDLDQEITLIKTGKEHER